MKPQQVVWNIMAASITVLVLAVPIIIWSFYDWLKGATHE